MIDRKAPTSALVRPSLMSPGLVNVDRRRLLRSGLSLVPTASTPPATAHRSRTVPLRWC